MGTYTSLARLGTAKWDSRTYKGTGPERPEEPAPIEDTRFMCSECSQYYAFGGECSRCGVPTVDRTRALPASKQHLPRPLFSLPSKGSPGMYLLALAAVGIPLAYVPIVELFEANTASPNQLRALLGGLGIVAALALIVPTVAVLTRSARRRRKLRKLARKTRAAAERIPALSTAELPEQTDERVRVRGRVRFDVGATDVRVRVADEHGAATLPGRPRILARSSDGELEELDSVRDGDEVEVVGLGRHVRAAADGYRDVAQEFAFDAEQPLEVWVRRSGA